MLSIFFLFSFKKLKNICVLLKNLKYFLVHPPLATIGFY